MPMKDAVERVLKVEAEGKRLLAEARLKAERILLDAESRAREMEEAALRSAGEKAARIREERLRESEAQRERLLAEVQAGIERERREKEPLIDEAVRKALDSLLK